MKESVTIRLDDQYRNFKAHGFNTMTEFIEAGLKKLIEEKNYEVVKAGKILDQLATLIQVLELEETDDQDKKKMIDACYSAAKVLASITAMLESPLNQVKHEDQKLIYKYEWAL